MLTFDWVGYILGVGGRIGKNSLTFVPKKEYRTPGRSGELAFFFYLLSQRILSILTLLKIYVIRFSINDYKVYGPSAAILTCIVQILFSTVYDTGRPHTFTMGAFCCYSIVASHCVEIGCHGFKLNKIGPPA